MGKIDVAGLLVDPVTMDSALDIAVSLIESGGHHYVVTPNAEMANNALENPDFLRILNGASLVLPDGAGLVKASEILGSPLPEKVAGVDFAPRLIGRTAGRRVYLFGGKEGVATAAADKLRAAYPGVLICGTRSGYYTDEKAVLAEIKASSPDILFVCLGSPKQELFMHRYRDELGIPLMAGLGGTLDVLAGTVKRAPEFFIKANLEWFYRLLRQPSRLGRMMTIPSYLMKCRMIRMGVRRPPAP